MNEIKYEQDFYGWTQEQARLLREGRFAELDVTNVVEEIETLGRSERRELVSHLCVLLTHLLKWAYQPARRTRSWRLSIETQRVHARTHLVENPSLKPQLDDIVAQAYRLALIEAERQTRLARRTFPTTCPWSFEQAMTDTFFPDLDA
jgi:Domain of unknown function DUF29